MARLISPPRDQLESLRTPLNRGERLVFEFFDRYLPQDWEIYIQPHLNGLRPDFVLLHPGVSIAVFEVKDWDLDKLAYHVIRDADGRPVLRATDSAGKTFSLDNPVDQVIEYKSQLVNLYCPRLGLRAVEDPRNLAVVTAGVIMLGASTSRARELLHPFLERLGLLGAAIDYHPVAGYDDLMVGNMRTVFPTATWTRSKYMDSQFARDLRTWLIEPDYAASQREPLELDARQRELVLNREGTRFRRIKGPAGAGKSLVLAARAAHLSREGRQVLAVTFNITLWHNLRDLAKRYPTPMEARTTDITWVHFHEWCKRVCYAAGMEREYKALFARSDRQGDELFDIADDPADDVLEKLLPALTARAIDGGADRVPRYDAILVDEGQDFNLEWWNVLRKVCRPEGEMLLVAEETQDLYARASAWTEASMQGAGFRGPWATLDRSYRMPVDFVPYLQRFIEDHLQGATVNLPQPVQRSLDDGPLSLRWIQVDASDATAACVEAVLTMPAFADPDSLAFSDVTLLVDRHAFGLECVEWLQANGVNVVHVFDRDKRRQKRRKIAFWMGDAKVKAATIHSFKGWESRALVIFMRSAKSSRSRAGFYAAMSRLKRHARGSYLTVVCAAPELAGYGRTWPAFEHRTGGSLQRPLVAT
jgi:hypothetical protein